jgi:HK97 family phage prohead protease
MTMTEIALQRREAGMPAGPARMHAFPAQELRASVVERDGQEKVALQGYATIFERTYDMWDMFGPYQEGISRGALDESLAAKPDVAFLVNHKGVTMARSTAGTLELAADSTGLAVVAYLNPKRQDVQDLVHAIEDRDVDQMSFAFRIPEGGGRWSDDFSQFWISKADIHRGDVSAVNYGANPYTSIAARSGSVLADLEHLPLGAARAAQERLAARLGTQTERAPEPEMGMSVALLRTMLDAG